jgi:DNA-binding transcriptional ArsR family regulator
MIHDLAGGKPRTAGQLGRKFCSSQPTISRHLKVLERAGLVSRRIEGREHVFKLRRHALDQAAGWIARHQEFWEGAVGQLDALLAHAVDDDAS